MKSLLNLEDNLESIYLNTWKTPNHSLYSQVIFVTGGRGLFYFNSKRFDYGFYEESRGKIYESIEYLDRLGMESISTLNSKSFLDYLTKYENTICGRNPIQLMLNVSFFFGNIGCRTK